MDFELDYLWEESEELTQPRPIETAPKDKQILAWCIHAADPYYLDNGKRLTTYAAHYEVLGGATDGFQVVEWGGECVEEYFGEELRRIPDWWFVVGTDFEMVANPVCWWPLPQPPQEGG